MRTGVQRCGTVAVCSACWRCSADCRSPPTWEPVRRWRSRSSGAWSRSDSREPQDARTARSERSSTPRSCSTSAAPPTRTRPRRSGVTTSRRSGWPFSPISARHRTSGAPGSRASPSRPGGPGPGCWPRRPLPGGRSSAVAPAATCEVARDASRRLGLPESVQTSLFHAVASWNGKGYPPAAGEAIPLSARVMHVASTAVLFALHAGDEAAVAAVRRRVRPPASTPPVRGAARRSAELLDGIDELDAYEEVLDARAGPGPLRRRRRGRGGGADLRGPGRPEEPVAARAIPRVSPELAAAAVADLGLTDEVRSVRLAGYLHDLGRAGISSRIWDKPGPLSRTERDQARLHAYQSERILARVPALADVAVLAGQHHERCDGSGYHRGRDRAPAHDAVPGARGRRRVPDLGRGPAAPGRRSRRRRRPTDCSGRGQVRRSRRGRGGGGAATAGLGGGARARGAGRPHGTAGRGAPTRGDRLSNREIADRLAISSRTAEHHVQDIYLRIGASTRAAAALFAMEHGLLGDEPG